MKIQQFRSFFKTVTICSLLACSSLQAGEFNFYYGVGYNAGGKEVANWYEDNLPVEVKGLIGFSAELRLAYKLDNNFRIDVGTGGINIIRGDLSYTSIPLNITAGYDFKMNDDLNLYTRGGLSYNIMNGDFVVDKAGVGFVAAVGLEYGHGFMEISTDTAKASFGNDLNKEDVSINKFTFTIGGFF